MGLDLTLYVEIDLGGPGGPESIELYSCHITHNLNKMAKEAGIYGIVWRPEELGIEYAGQIVEGLDRGILELKSHRTKYIKHDNPNGWGTYDGFVPWLEKLLDACKRYPKARVYACR